MHTLHDLWNLPTKDLFALSVLAALVSMVGSLAATVLKDYVFVRSLEKWKARRELRTAYLRSRNPLTLATTELLNRFEEILFQSPVDFLEPSLLDEKPMQTIGNSADDRFYQRYKLVSSVYRLCAWMGWTELYRRETTYLDSGHHRTNQRFEGLIANLRSDIADGHLNEADDWQVWIDSLVFREEQRAIGESMIDSTRNTVIGYGEFCKQFEAGGSGLTHEWTRRAASFLFGLRSEAGNKKDFRRARCLMFIVHGVDLLECLDSSRVRNKYRVLREKAVQELEDYPVQELELHTKAVAAIAR